MADHPTKDELSGFVLGTLPPESTDLVAEHVEKCQPCQETVCQLDSHKDTLLDGLRRPAPPVDEACRKAVDKVVAFAKAGDKSVTSNQASPPSISTPAAESGPSREQFVSALRAVQIIDEADWARLQKESPAVAQAADGATLARALVAHGTLTKFQATALYQGKAKSLVFGEYILLDLLGSGGMGQVFKARHRSMDRVVALKVLAKTAVNSPEAVKRFQREVKAAAKLHHPNIVTAFDASRQDGVHYLVMEYVEGSDLSAVVKRDGPLPIEKAIDYIRQAARGLEYAHAEGVVHRDIKPANLLLDRKGVVKILDMGLARLDNDAAARDAGEGLTQTGQVMGTVDYMAPEQAFDTSRADGKADMYSLGCSLHRILTGQSMYVGETLIQKLLAHREHPIPSLRTVRAEVPAALDALYQRMVAKRPEDRPTMAEAAMELEALANPSPTETLLPSVVIDVAGKGATDKRPAAGAKSAAGLGSPEPTQPKPQAGGTGRKPPQKAILAAAAAGAFALIAFGVWLVIRNDRNEVVAKIEAPPGTRIEVPAGGSVEVVGDVSSNKLDSKIGAATWVRADGFATRVPSTETTVSPSRGDYALRFGDGATVEMPSLQEQFDAGKSFTVECWVTPGYLPNGKQYTADSPLAEFQGEVPVLGFQHGPPLFLIINNSGNWSFNLQVNELLQRAELPTGATYSLQPAGVVSGTKNLYLTGGGESRSRRWHLAAVRKGNRLQFFRDGKLHQTLEFPNVTIKPGGASFSLGGKHGEPARYFHGLIDEVRLSQTARYEQDFTPVERFDSDADTTALYHFDEGMGDVLHDASGNKHDGKIVGAKWVRADGSATPATLPVASSSGVAVVPRTPLPDGPPGQLPSIPVPENPRMVVVANDGRHVGFMGGLGHPIWLDLTTGKNVWQNTTGHAAYIRGSRLSPDGTQWALVGNAHDSQFAYVRVLRTTDGREEWNYLAEGPQFVGVAFSPDGKQLAVGNVAGEVLLFELPGSREVRRWQAHDTPVHAVAYSRDGLRLVTGAAATTVDATSTPTKQPTLKMWRVADGIEIPDFFRTTGRSSRVDAEVTRDGRFLLVGSPTDTALVWDMQTGENLASIRNESKGQRAGISETPSGTHALVGGDTMLIVEPATGRVLLEMRDAESRHIHDPIPTPNGRFAIAWGEKQLRIWRLPPECWAPGIAGTVPAAAAGTLATNRTLADPAFQQWLVATQKLPAEQQLAEFSKKLMELNPGFDGKLSGGYGQANPVIDKGVVTGVGFSTVKVSNISPVRLFTELTDLRCNGEAVPNTGALTDLSPLKGLRLKTLSCGENRITDLSPLQGMPLLRLDAYANPLGDISALLGMPLTHLSLNNTSYVMDVSPLRGMPLRYFSANSLKATDLSPLAGLPLEGLTLRGAAATDLSPLKNCTALKTLELTRFRGSPDEIVNLQRALPNCKIDWDNPATPAASAPNDGAPTKNATLADPAFQAWLKATQALPADKQLEAVSKKLMELNPGFDGKLLGGDGYKVPKIEKGVVTGIGFITDQVTDISPVRAFPGLRDLYCRGSNSINGQSLGKLVDLSPLSGLPLQSISATYNPIQDLSPLSGMPLTSLDVAWAKVSDLSPLAGMPLEALGINGNQGIKDIRTLRGMPLKRLSMISKPVSDLSPLAGMQLESLSFASTQVADISVLRGMPLTWIDMGNTKVTDLSPLHDCKTLKSLSIKNQKIDPAEIAKLQQALPECKIEFSLPETTPAAAPSPATNGAWQQESDPDRRVARWVLARGGKVGVLVNGSARKDIARLEDLPAESFVVTNVYRPSGLLPITADEWSSLGELRFAQAIDLCGCKPTDDALAALARCPNLTYLVMAFSEPFGDEGLKHLSAATQLEYLDLGGCAMTAAGLEHLGKLTRLRSLKIQNTKQLQLTTLAPLLTLRNLEEVELYATTATDAVVAELAALPRLRFLNLKNSRCSPEITDTLLKLRGLYAVSLEGLKLSAPGLRKLADHPTLTVVCVWGAGIAMEEYDRLVPELPKITLVHEQLAPKYADELAAYDWFKTVGDVGSGHYAPLRDSQAAFGLVTSVSVSQPVAPDDFRRLAALANVTSLVLTSNDTTDEHLRAAFAALRGRPHLTSLTLYGPKFTSAAALDDLAVHENLRSLHLGRSSLPTDEATAFVAKLPHLRSLRLESSGLTDGVFAHLAPLVELELLELTNAPKISGARLDVLRSMPNLRRLALNETGVNDAALAALPNLPVLEHLSLEKTAVTDAGLEHLAHCRRLRTIGLRSTQVTAQAVARLQAALPECFIVCDIAANVGKLQSAADSPEFQQWMKEVAALPADKQLEAVSKKLMELNPGFNGKLTGVAFDQKPQVENGAVIGVGLITDSVTDVTPVRAFPGLKKLEARGGHLKGQPIGKFADLSQLSGLPLTSLNVHFNPVTDLTPLRGMPLTFLGITDSRVADLAPLTGMPLATLQMNNAWRVSDVSPLRGMPLRQLNMNGSKVADLSPLAGMPLDNLSIGGTQVTDISVLRGMPLTWIDMGNTKVTDLSPLHDCKMLKTLLIKNQKIDPAEIRKLQQALPECKIEWDYPAEATPVKK